MKNKKYSCWMISGIYFLVFLFISILLSVVISFLLLIISGFFPQAFIMSVYKILGFIIPFVIIWLAIKLAASLINKKFVVKNVEKVIILATIYNIGVELLMRFVSISEMNGASVIHNYPLELAFSFLSIVLFYLFSRRYLRGK